MERSMSRGDGSLSLKVFRTKKGRSVALPFFVIKEEQAGTV